MDRKHPRLQKRIVDEIDELLAEREYLPLQETCFILLCSIFSSLHICTVVEVS